MSMLMNLGNLFPMVAALLVAVASTEAPVRDSYRPAVLVLSNEVTTCREEASVPRHPVSADRSLPREGVASQWRVRCDRLPAEREYIF